MKTVPGIIALATLLMVSANALAGCEQYAIDTSEGTVRDTTNGIVWSRCLIGQSQPNCFGVATSLNWVDALNRARSAKLAGISNWRLPRIEEFQKLPGAECLAQVFPGNTMAIVWSASANLDHATDARVYDFVAAKVAVYARAERLSVMLIANLR